MLLLIYLYSYLTYTICTVDMTTDKKPVTMVIDPSKTHTPKRTELASPIVKPVQLARKNKLKDLANRYNLLTVLSTMFCIKLIYGKLVLYKINIF